MRIHRFYCPEDLSIGQEFILPTITYRHAIQVLRLRIGQELILFNGLGGEYYATLQSVNRKLAKVLIHKFDPIKRESNLPLTLVQSLVKPDRMDLCIQKTVELGITAIQPIITKRSVIKISAARMKKKLQHWQQIIISACEQSGRTQIPQLFSPIHFQNWLQSLDNQKTMGFIMSPTAKIGFYDLPNDIEHKNLQLLIGSEGGFTDQEIQACLTHGIKEFNFGKRILRAETAAITGICSFQQRWGDI